MKINVFAQNRMNKAFNKALEKIGKYAYTENYKINNGIRSIMQLMPFVIAMYKFPNVKSPIFSDKKPSDLGYEDKSCIKADLIMQNVVTGDRVIVEETCMRDPMNTRKSKTAMVDFEASKLGSDMREFEADKGFIVLDYHLFRRYPKTIERMQKAIDKEFKDCKVIGLKQCMPELIRPYANVSYINCKKNVKELADHFSELLSVGLRPDTLVTEEEVLMAIYACASYAFGFDLDERFKTHGLGATCFYKLSQETGISQYMLHMFYEDECKKRFARNKADIKVLRKAQIVSLAAKRK